MYIDDTIDMARHILPINSMPALNNNKVIYIWIVNAVIQIIVIYIFSVFTYLDLQ